MQQSLLAKKTGESNSLEYLNIKTLKQGQINRVAAFVFKDYDHVIKILKSQHDTVPQK